MNTNSKFLKFVANLEHQIIDNNEELILLSRNVNDNFGGNLIITNGDRCINSSSACQGSINDYKCSNGNCDNSSNGKRCTTIQSTLTP